MLMASSTHFLYLTFFIASFTQVFPLNEVMKSSLMYPLTCSDYTHTCDSYLYHISKGHKLDEIASFYSVNTSRITPVNHQSNLDYLVSVRCACEKDNNGNGYYLYDSVYKRKPGESVRYVSDEYYSGQVWYVSGEDEEQLTLHLVCGCLDDESRKVVTYTIQAQDTLLGVSQLLSAKENELLKNKKKKGLIIYRNHAEAASNIESEKPVIISLEEIEQATNSFDEARKIGEGGYGSVYFGIIRQREAAIKKMRSNKSKEFFAELKVLCRIHHNNVVRTLY
ncbi:putative protein kinase RLK-Pelle-RLCK-IXb family [Helianthus annuus]|nr:putative protein kinase RLK-Pelle-RLCK-IXb family [Helianthus annuus]KAJ0748167.1 putative protein kinase RLK-Pelle-RLCK-IXb family [Helianthus annuus]